MSARPSPTGALAALLFAVASIAACGGGTATGSVCPPTQTLTYANFGEPFMSKYCTSCHNGRESPNLASVGSIRSHRADVDTEAAAGPNATNTSMPEGSTTPTDEERRQLGEWLACGAP